MNVQIRKATSADVHDLTALAMRSKQSNGYDQAFMDACAHELTVTAADLDKSSYWVAETSIICGMVGLTVDENGRAGEVCALFVDPSCKRQGIGQILWQAVLDYAAAHGLASLRLDADPAAVPFYQSVGCHIVGEVPSGSIVGRSLPHMTIALPQV